MNVKNFVKQWREVNGERGRFKSDGTADATEFQKISTDKPRSNVVANERADYQKFWLTLIRDVFDIDKPENFINFEVPVQLAHKSFIDGYFPDTNVLIEQKACGVDLEKEITQSDGTKLTPYEQARRYVIGLPVSMHPKKIITCNFKEFLIYDMETLKPPIKILLEELPEKFHALDFLIDKERNKIRIELELSLKAGEIVGKLYNALLAQYVNPNSAESQASLNKLCVRLVFCLYAESSGIFFGKHKIFRDWLEGARNIRWDLIHLFDVLNTPIDERDPYLDDTLKKFPYVNGGLFSGSIEIPNFTPKIRELLFEEASSGFNWSGISPTIFGAVFESTLNPETRRAGGMHYTAIENIHKVIDPLFLDELKAEFDIAKIPSRNRKKNLLAFQDKLASLKIFDPACGSGNFLTESYLSLRRLENELLKELLGSQIQLGELVNPIKVSIGQFYGIEINDFAVAVAQTALWIAELQMMQDTREIIHRDLDFLPLKSYSNIHEGNALKIDWQKICPQPNYIIGNPPFVGASMMNAAQKAEAVKIFGKVKLSNSVDYVGAWYHLAAKFMTGTNIKAAFVSTNSITQGEQLAPLWKKVFDEYNMQIIFARRTFKWDSESLDKASVHCVVICIADKSLPVEKKIFDGDEIISAKNINPYLCDAPTIFIESRAKHLQDFVPRIILGNKPSDGGNLILSPAERKEILQREPALEKFIFRYVGGNEFINNIERYCLWLVNATPKELRKSKELYRRVDAVRKMREASTSAATRKTAETPHKFFFISQPTTEYILIPCHSSGGRKYIPMGFVSPDIIASNANLIIPNATLYHFGILTSSIHMAWMRTVCGYLGTSYRYSSNVVYNNFPWCEPTDNRRRAIETTAQKILDARKNYPDSTLADLYDELTMPADLRKAHRENDKAVALAYGFENILDDEAKIVGELMNRYVELTSD